MTRPERASRLWLAMAIATLWTVSVGGAVEAAEDGSAITLEALTAELCVPLPVTPTRRSRPRLLKLFPARCHPHLRHPARGASTPTRPVMATSVIRP